MKTFTLYRKSIAWGVSIAFFLLIQGGASALSAPRADKAETVAAAPNDGETPGAIERMGGAKAPAKKKFPWLIVAGGVVVVGVVLYFTVFKKSKYDLTVTVGQGVEGSPANGTYTYKKGTVVNYSYTAKTGYISPTVKLDGSNIAASGSITMNADHTLEVNAAEGLHDDFTSTASSLWTPYQASEWSVSGGQYHCNFNRTLPTGYNWNYNRFNHAISQTTYTVTVRMQRTAYAWPFAVVLAAGTNMEAVNGYLFDLRSDESYYIGRYTNYNLVQPGGGDSSIQGWTYNPDINSGLGAWNTLKVSRSGSSYTMTVNDTVLKNFTESTHDPRYVVLVHVVGSNVTSQINYDYVYIDVGSSPASSYSPFKLLASPGSTDLAGRDSTGH